jgi:hypothetical protein
MDDTNGSLVPVLMLYLLFLLAEGAMFGFGAAIQNLNDADAGELPGMGNVADNGRSYKYGQRTKRKKRYDPDTLPEQVKIHFTDYDASTTDATEKSYGEKADDYLRDLAERARKEAEDGA